MRVFRPAPMAGQPWRCAGVGSPSAARNHWRTGGRNISSGSPGSILFSRGMKWFFLYFFFRLGTAEKGLAGAGYETAESESRVAQEHAVEWQARPLQSFRMAQDVGQRNPDQRQRGRHRL